MTVASVLGISLAGEAATRELGMALGQAFVGGEVVALCGDLGAGKTTFTQGLAVGLGLAPDARVVSPTYNLVRSYEARFQLHHIDLYRLGHPDELIHLGFEDLISRESVVVVEWADRFPEVFPPEAIWIRLEWVDFESRRLSVGPTPLLDHVVAALRPFLGGQT